jgi:hypothetical protein
MGKIVESRYCPTCGKDHNEVKKFEIPVDTVIDSAGVKELESLFIGLADKVEEMARKVPEINQQVAKALEQATKHFENEVGKLAKALTAHPKPSERFIEEVWESCPECKPEWEKIKAKLGTKHLDPEHIKDCPECQELLAKAGYKKPEEVEVPQASASQEQSTWWWAKR